MNIQTMLQWFRDRKNKVTYSMIYRNGPSSFDCSSSVYYALIAAGYLPAGTRIGNTDSLFGDLERNGWTKLQLNAQGNYDTQAGDIFIWGRRGASGGAAGHTGAFLNADDVIHCNAYYNTIYVNNYDFLAQANGWPEATFYRYTGASLQLPSIVGSPTDQVLDIGSTIRFDGAYTVDDLQHIGGVWQIKTNVLCPEGFTWDDNGIPADPLVEIDGGGYATVDQELAPGASYKIPGKYTVLDLGQEGSMWLALIEIAGMRLWVDVATATEIASTDAGTPTPGMRPIAPTPQTPSPVEVPPVPEIPVELPDTNSTTPDTQAPKTPPVQIEDNKPKENIMAFTQEQQKDLQVATQKVLDANEFTPVIGDKVKTITYFATDIAAIVSGFIFTLLAIFHVMDAVVAITVNAAVTTALLGVKQTFRLSSKKQ